MKLIETIFYLMLIASLASTVIILPLLVFRKLLYKRLGPRIFHILWFLVLIKLLVPIAPQSPVSLFNLVPHSMQYLSFGPTWSAGPSHFIEIGPEPGVTFKKNSEVADFSPAPRPKQTAEPSPIVTPSPQTYIYEIDQDLPQKLLTIASLVWLAGILSLSMYTLFVAVRFRKRVGASRKLDNQEVLSILEACKEKLGIQATIPIYETDRLHSPCIYGLTKPSIYLPADIVTIADSRQLTHILLHELTHYKRNDLWLNLLWTLTVMLHWYNPIVWLSMRQIKADQEVACDAGVLEVLGEQESSSYGMTLLMLSRLFTRSASPQVNLSNFFENTKEMKRRITMIAKFKKGSYKLSAAAIILFLGLSTVLLTNASESAQSAESITGFKQGRASSFKIQRLNDWAKWFHNLGRSNDFAGFSFKVPDYLPDGYQLRSIDVHEKFVNRTDNQITINFISNFGKDDEQQFEVMASKGNLLNGALSQILEGSETRRIPGPSWGAAQPQSYIQDEVTYANIRGILVTTVQKYENHPQEIAKSFFWRDEGVYYAIQFYSEDHTLEEGISRNRRHISQDELEKILRSFTNPQHLQHVSYDGVGNSFPIYDEKDLQLAKKTLGFQVKFPLALANNELKLTNSVMLMAGDQNTYYSFRQTVNAINTSYRATDDSAKDKLKGELTVYQSKLPLIDGSALTLTRTLNMNGNDISVYRDDKHIYGGPYYHDMDKTDIINQTYYLWKQKDIYYAAHLSDADANEPNQAELVKAFLLAPQ